MICQWWATCTNDAALERDHPILGAVPICYDCNDRCDKLEG